MLPLTIIFLRYRRKSFLAQPEKRFKLLCFFLLLRRVSKSFTHLQMQQLYLTKSQSYEGDFVLEKSKLVLNS